MWLSIDGASYVCVSAPVLPGTGMVLEMVASMGKCGPPPGQSPGWMKKLPTQLVVTLKTACVSSSSVTTALPTPMGLPWLAGP